MSQVISWGFLHQKSSAAHAKDVEFLTSIASGPPDHFSCCVHTANQNDIRREIKIYIPGLSFCNMVYIPYVFIHRGLKYKILPPLVSADKSQGKGSNLYKFVFTRYNFFDHSSGLWVNQSLQYDCQSHRCVVRVIWGNQTPSQCAGKTCKHHSHDRNW